MVSKNWVIIIMDEKISLNNQNNGNLQKYLNAKAREYLTLISKEYGSYMNQKQILFLERLLKSDNIVVEKDSDAYIQNQVTSIDNDSTLTEVQKQEIKSTFSVPLAHGGRVFNDDKIHFYPFILKNQDKNYVAQNCQQILVHELLHYFVRPKYINNNYLELNQINDFITEGLVDMLARDIQIKYNLFNDYSSEYGENVMFVRDALSNLETKKQQLTLAFNGNVQDILNYSSITKYNAVKNKETDFQKIVNKTIGICLPNSKHQDSLYRSIINQSANFKSKNAAYINLANKVFQFFGKEDSLIKEINSKINHKDSKQFTHYNNKYSFSANKKINLLKIKKQLLLQKQTLKNKQIHQNNMSGPTLAKVKSGFINIVYLITLLGTIITIGITIANFMISI